MKFYITLVFDLQFLNGMLQHTYFLCGITSTDFAYISCPKSVVGLG